MAIRDIISFPDSRLRLVCAPVDRVDDTVRTLMNDMLDTMYEAPGVGLAAIQIAVPRRVVVIDIADGVPLKPVRMVNPEIISFSEDMSSRVEGCLSIPDYTDTVERPTRCTVRFLDETGERRVIDCDGLMATVVQHEVDHLNGVLFIDHLSKLKRDRITRKFIKARKRAAAL